MGVSIWLVWRTEPSKTRTIGIRIFWLQLFFNVFWTYLFFGIQRIDLGLFEIFFLIFLIITNIIYFLKINKIAGYLLTPYLFWVIYAAILNYNIWILNSWRGRQDSNLRMRVPKTRALPLGDAPIKAISIIIILKSRFIQRLSFN